MKHCIDTMFGSYLAPRDMLASLQKNLKVYMLPSGHRPSQETPQEACDIDRDG